MKRLIWHLPRPVQRAITWATGYRVTRFTVGGRTIGFQWRRWPR